MSVNSPAIIMCVTKIIIMLTGIILQFYNLSNIFYIELAKLGLGDMR